MVSLILIPDLARCCMGQTSLRSPQPICRDRRLLKAGKDLQPNGRSSFGPAWCKSLTCERTSRNVEANVIQLVSSVPTRMLHKLSENVERQTQKERDRERDAHHELRDGNDINLRPPREVHSPTFSLGRVGVHRLGG
jgi:hypothetical protein